MAKKSTVIHAEGLVKFTEALNDWLAKNDNIKIVSISHSCNTGAIPQKEGTYHFLTFFALIVYEVKKEVFGV